MLEKRLGELVRGWEEDPQSCGGALGDLLATDGQKFFTASLPLLRNGDDTAGLQFLVSLLMQEELLLKPLCDPVLFNEQQAAAVARVMARVDPGLDVKLARRLKELDAGAAQRVLAILDAISDGSRIIFILAGLMRHSNERLRSKAALLIGRTVQKPEVFEHLEESDPRVRANAIEALWGLDSPAARALLLKTVNDPHCRTAANAMVGLHKLGEQTVIPLILAMAQLPDMGIPVMRR